MSNRDDPPRYKIGNVIPIKVKVSDVDTTVTFSAQTVVLTINGVDKAATWTTTGNPAVATTSAAYDTSALSAGVIPVVAKITSGGSTWLIPTPGIELYA